VKQPGSPIRVGIVEDEDLLRAMLVDLVAGHPSLEAAGAASGVADAKEKFPPGSIDLVMMDVALGDGNGVTLGVAMQRADPDLTVMLLSSHDLMDLVISIGANVSRPWSYLSKRSSVTKEILFRAIEAAAQGEVILDPELTERATARVGTAVAELTAAQFQVLRLVAQGFSNSAVAELLGLSRRSVENHIQTIYRILRISSREGSPRVAAVLQFLQQTARK
jgi:DNA-binding NarL/FixJ family response regulator